MVSEATRNGRGPLLRVFWEQGSIGKGFRVDLGFRDVGFWVL